MKDLSRKREEERLLEIIKKCNSLDRQVHESLKGMSLSSLISEAVDEDDISEVKKAIQKGRDQINQLKDYVNAMSIDLPDAIEYADELEGALDKAQAELAKASFDAGALSNFFGEKVTLPEITKASIALYTKTSDFYNGFVRAFDNIKDNIIPLAKDVDEETTLRDAAGSGNVPDEATLQKGLDKALKQSLGATFFGKLKSFFTKGMFGAEKKIMDALPERDLGQLASLISIDLLDAKIKDFETEVPKEEKSTQQALEDNAKEAAEEDAAAAERSQQSTSGEEPAPASGQAAEDAQEEAESQLRTAIESESTEAQPPGVAVTGAIEAWFDNLSKTSQQTLSAAGRYDGLKTAVKTTLDNAADTVADAIRDSISSWRSEHEETLVRSKRFAKKNFDSLEQLVPQLASFMMKKVEESSTRLTKEKIRRITFNFLDKRFKPGSANVLNEKYDLDELSAYRLNKLAGLDT